MLSLCACHGPINPFSYCCFQECFFFPFLRSGHFILSSFHSLAFPEIVLTAFCSWYFLLNDIFYWQTLWLTLCLNRHIYSAHTYYSHVNSHASVIVEAYKTCTLFFFCVLFVFNFMFCRQLNCTGRFHGLASLDDITAIISTPPLAGFQVASPNWCLN